VAVSEGFVAGLPKAELHVHHVGSLSQRVVAELAARHPGTVPSDPDKLARLGRPHQPRCRTDRARHRRGRRPPLLEHLVEHAIGLDLCLTSNVALQVVPDLDHHPIRELVAAGVTVTINTDDPPMVGTDLNTEYAIAARRWTSMSAA
jgi:adenosine deaminase